MGLRFHAVVSMGNCVDVTPGELLAAIGQQPETSVVGLYLEGSRDGASIFLAAPRTPRPRSRGGDGRRAERARTRRRRVAHGIIGRRSPRLGRDLTRNRSDR